MADEQPKAETPVAESPPMTAQDFLDALDRLFERAKSAGIRPFQVMTASYVHKGISVIDSLLVALEDGDPKKK